MPRPQVGGLVESLGLPSVQTLAAEISVSALEEAIRQSLQLLQANVQEELSRPTSTQAMPTAFQRWIVIFQWAVLQMAVEGH